VHPAPKMLCTSFFFFFFRFLSSTVLLPSKSIYTSCLYPAQKTPDVFTPKADHHNNNKKNCPEFPSPQFLTCLSSLAYPKPTHTQCFNFSFIFSFSDFLTLCQWPASVFFKDFFCFVDKMAIIHKKM
jgi:hypothetical protein